eukprot:2772709-Pyramimonas_sp.AAC.1
MANLISGCSSSRSVSVHWRRNLFSLAKANVDAIKAERAAHADRLQKKRRLVEAGETDGGDTGQEAADAGEAVAPGAGAASAAAAAGTA